MSVLGRINSSGFPTYILPSLPFRRKSSTDSNASASNDATSPTSQAQSFEAALPHPHPSSSSLQAASPPQRPRELLTSTTSYLRCARCASDLCLTDQIVSRGFTGRFGRAYLVAPQDATASTASTASNPRATLPNTYTLKAVPRQLVTGAHTVSDVLCNSCGVGLGWKYVNADEEGQRYKVGKFILETKRVSAGTRWEAPQPYPAAWGEEAADDDDDYDVDWEGLGDCGGGRVEQLMRPALVDGEEVEFDSQDEDECEDLFLGQWSPEVALKRRRARKFGKR